MIGPLAYIGEKNRLAQKIIKIFPEHATYVEAFSRGAKVRSARYYRYAVGGFAKSLFAL
jgi:site-specific DNA-adenine methylase